MLTDPVESLHPVQKPDTIRDLGPVQIDRLVAIVDKVSEDVWLREDANKENKFACFHHTRHIVFRFIEGMRDHRVSYSRQIWTAWQGLLLPIIQSAIKPYGFVEPEFPKVMLARLSAGYGIDPHQDGAGSNLHTHKIHVPLFTNADALFYVDGQGFHLQKGRAYEVNNIKTHGVKNAGTTDRIHLIFEVFEASKEKA